MSIEAPAAGFMDGLVARGPDPDLGAQADTYGRLIGSWGKSTPESFVWQGFELDPDGSPWRVVTEFNLRRRR